MKLKDIHDKMRNIIVKCGYPQSRYDKLIDLDDDKFLLKELKSMESLWKEAKDIRDLLPEDKWEYYDLQEISGLREQLLWEDVSQRLRKECYERLIKARFTNNGTSKGCSKSSTSNRHSVKRSGKIK